MHRIVARCYQSFSHWGCHKIFEIGVMRCFCLFLCDDMVKLVIRDKIPSIPIGIHIAAYHIHQCEHSISFIIRRLNQRGVVKVSEDCYRHLLRLDRILRSSTQLNVGLQSRDQPNESNVCPTSFAGVGILNTRSLKLLV
ncbi:MAG: hypothetical protein BWY49_00065 [Candidatus Omnitrophica bacterium ADurb.Bin314]|nr:MAG: hypothetical protein BWY49_00065 [Candidatus Omnitrophica bacterium ADurb.Bin314]